MFGLFFKSLGSLKRYIRNKAEIEDRRTAKKLFMFFFQKHNLDLKNTCPKCEQTSFYMLIRNVMDSHNLTSKNWI